MATMEGLGADPHQAGKNYDQAEGENDDSGPVAWTVVLKEGLADKSVFKKSPSFPLAAPLLRRSKVKAIGGSEMVEYASSFRA